ncbi:MAG: ketopantoate reductase family protein [Anaerolineae bacterium]
MRIVILGSGALGCVYAARLAGRAETWMLGTWAEGIAAVRRTGIQITDPDGHTWRAHVRATTDPAEVPVADYVLVLVKSYQTGRAAAWAAQVLGPTGLAVTLQNGLDNGPKLVAVLGPERVAVGVTYNGATLLGPAQVRHAARELTRIGVTPGTEARVSALVALLNQAGLEAQVTSEVESLLWGKAVANAAINPLTALWRVPNGQVCATAERRALLADLASEAAAVATARGVTLPFPDPVAYAESVCQRTAANRSSMLQDIERGRQTEIDSITGVIVAEGRRLGVPTPVSQVVWRLVRGISESANGGNYLPHPSPSVHRRAPGR